jgi:hypothetical protein
MSDDASLPLFRVSPPPHTAGGWAKFGQLIAGSVLGGNAAQPLGGVPEAVDWCPEGWC